MNCQNAKSYFLDTLENISKSRILKFLLNMLSLSVLTKCIMKPSIMDISKKHCSSLALFVLRFYGPVNPMKSCRARSVYLATRLLGRRSPLSG